jgi:hypothetical protein
MTYADCFTPCTSNVAGPLRVNVLVAATCPNFRFITLITRGGNEEICASYVLYQRL